MYSKKLFLGVTMSKIQDFFMGNSVGPTNQPQNVQLCWLCLILLDEKTTGSLLVLLFHQKVSFKSVQVTYLDPQNVHENILWFLSIFLDAFFFLVKTIFFLPKSHTICKFPNVIIEMFVFGWFKIFAIIIYYPD